MSPCPRDSTVAGLLSTHHPQVHQVATESTYYSMALLSSGAVDAAIATLIDANHMLANSNDLVIRSTVGTEPATFSMATTAMAGELASILDKALLSISPEELGVINSRWRDHGMDDAYWRNYRRIILQVVGVIGILLVVALVWNARLRRQIRQRQRAERALNDQLEFMGALLNGTPHPMYVRDREAACRAAMTATFRPWAPTSTRSSASVSTIAPSAMMTTPARCRTTTARSWPKAGH